MALKLLLNDDQYGLSEGERYIKIDDMYWKKENASIRALMFASQQARLENKRELSVLIYSCPVDLQSSDNFVVQAYKFLKTLPEFENAVDC